tara:strand:+ start:84 stop:758 length:675 start_codon:yes stop_codon:yes gene_type:complete
MKKRNLIFLGIILMIISLFYYFDLKEFLSLTGIQTYLSRLIILYEDYPILFISISIISIIILSGVSIPILTGATLTGGAILGPIPSAILLTLSISIGATFAMLSSRYIFRDYIEKKFSKEIKLIDSIINNRPIITISAIRMIPIFPFTIINLVLGVTHIKIKKYFIGTMIGMFPIITLFSYAGQQLSQISEINDIFTPEIIIIMSIIITLSIITLIIKHRLPKE